MLIVAFFIVMLSVIMLSVIMLSVVMLNVMKQVAWSKSSLLLRIQKQNTQALQLFTERIKKGSIYKSN